MKRTTLSFLSIFILLTFINCSSNIEPIEDENTENVLDISESYQELDISYGSDSKQTFDLYLPANRTGNTKIMVLVHGGGWSGGDKEEMTDFKNILSQDFPNLAIVNINYRLADDNNKAFPMQIDDITTIVNHLKENKTKYTISEDLGFIGISAGAHLSMLWAYAFDENKKTNMVCSIVGPTNLTAPEYINAASENEELQGFLNLYGDATSTYLEEASPLHQVTATAPPTILFYGGKDPLIPTSQGTDLRDKLQTLGVTHEFTLYPNEGHGWVGLELLDTWLKLKVFINNNL